MYLKKRCIYPHFTRPPHTYLKKYYKAIFLNARNYFNPFPETIQDLHNLEQEAF